MTARRLGLRSAALAVALAALLAGQAAAWSWTSFPVRSLGNRGTDVLAIQVLLDHHGPWVRRSGVFDSSTRDAVRSFQSTRGLPATGVVDAPTWRALAPILDRGDRGHAVVALQRELVEKRRARIAVDGVFGSATRSAVVAFQRHAGLPADGVVRTATWQRLIGHFELPRFAAGLCDYTPGVAGANWGTAAAIAQVEAAARTVYRAGHGRVALGDAGLEHGGAIAGHASHRHGLDVDLRPMRTARDQCARGTSWRSAAYDRAATRALVRAIRAAAPGHVKLIWFNDPVLVREGLTRPYPGHDDHLHVRFCEAVHPVAAYTC